MIESRRMRSLVSMLLLALAGCGSEVDRSIDHAPDDAGPASTSEESDESTPSTTPTDTLPREDGGTTPAMPASPAKDGGSVDAADAGAACSPGAVCTPANTCRRGRVQCEDGVASCEESTSLPDGTACGTGMACLAGVCTAGSPVAANGTCTQREVPRILSCPTGMSCRCYDSPFVKFKDAPATLDMWLASDRLDVLGGTLPTNAAVSTPPKASIALTGSGPQTGSAAPYVATVAGLDVTVRLSRTVGYVSEKFIKRTSADCGHGGKILECTFGSP